MKKLILIASLLTVSYINAQAFKGNGDNKFQIGASFQDNATGINASYDVGVGENISLGLSSSYALNVNEAIDAKFQDRFDLKARFNANLGNVVNIDDINRLREVRSQLSNGRIGARNDQRHARYARVVSGRHIE